MIMSEVVFAKPKVVIGSGIAIHPGHPRTHWTSQESRRIRTLLRSSLTCTVTSSCSWRRTNNYATRFSNSKLSRDSRRRCRSKHRSTTKRVTERPIALPALRTTIERFIWFAMTWEKGNVGFAKYASKSSTQRPQSSSRRVLVTMGRRFFGFAASELVNCQNGQGEFPGSAGPPSANADTTRTQCS